MLQKKVAKQNEQKEQLNQRLNQRDQALAGRDAQLQDLNQTLTERATQIDVLNQIVLERDQALAGRDAQLQDLNQTLTERATQIDVLNQIVLERDQALAGRDAQLQDLNQTLAERDQQISTLSNTLTERGKQIEKLTQDYTQVLTAYQTTLNSTAWKITAPIRKLLDTSKRTVRRVLSSQAILRLKARRRAHATPIQTKTRSTKYPKWFNAKWYLTTNPDVRAAGLDPYEHYSNHGEFEGRQAAPESFQQNTSKVLKSLQSSVNQHGGPLRLSAHALKIVRGEGFSGLKHRLRTLRENHSDLNNYTKWVELYDTINDSRRKNIRNQISTFPRKPKISLIMPVYDPPIEFLDQAIRSVRNQLYPEWELCIADDASKNKKVIALLKKHSKEDPRIKVVFRKENGHISRASNSALELATGEFVALMDHDDLLPEHALFTVAETIVAHPDAKVIYSDEDKIDANGKRHSPYFKCELNPELLLAQNMICHLGVYKKSLINSIQGFRIGFEGSQDYDLALRAIEQVSRNQVTHIPRVLYHWRAIPGSTALAGDQKQYTEPASRKAVAEHLRRRGLKAEVMPAPNAPSHNRVRFALPDQKPLVSIIIPTKDRADLLETCIKSILSLTTYPAFEVIIIDNGSTEPETDEFFKQLPKNKVKVFHDPSPFNFSALNNHAAKVAQGELFCLLNNDIEILTPDWLEEMVSFAIQPGIGAVGARLWYENNTLQHGGIIIGLGGVAGHSHKHLSKESPGYFYRALLHQTLSAVTAACLVVRRDVFEEVGGLDESLAVAFNDVDFCLRIRESGYRNVWTPYAEMIHHESISRGYENTPEKQERFKKEILYIQKKWGDTLQDDPAYNPNLTRDREDFSLAWPPRTA